MRTLSSATLALLEAGLAVESICVVGVRWGGGAEVFYGDRGVDASETGGDRVPPKILELSGLDDTSRLDGGGKTSTCAVVLDDVDGSLKAIFDAVDVHFSRATVYQWFRGVSWSDRFKVLDGVVNTPLSWDEGARTFSFDIVSRIESVEVGYDISDGGAPNVPQELLGTPWPMLFGTVLHYPGLVLRNVPTGFITQPFGVPDPGLEREVADVAAHIASLNDAINAAFLNAIIVCFTEEAFDIDALANGLFDNSKCNSDPNVQRWNQLAVQLQEEAQTEKAKMDQLARSLTAQLRWARGSVPIQPNIPVQVPYNGTLRLGNNLFDGGLTNAGGGLSCRPVLQPGELPAQVLKQGFQFYPVGTQVAIAGPYPIPFAVSLVPGTVKAVWAYRSANGTRGLTRVPESWYTVGSLDVGRFTCVTVTLNEPLSTIAFTQNLAAQNWETNFGQYLAPHIVSSVDWDDQIYVTFASSVGPNALDIIAYIAATYLPGLAIDGPSFSATHAAVAGLPMNFGVSARTEALAFIESIAYQARCAVWIADETLYFKYLPAAASPVGVITEDDIVDASLSVNCTPTESLVTKYVATYRPDYTPTYQEPCSVVLRRNIRLYGTHEEARDFFCYHDYYAVEKAATFWMIRSSTTWKYIKAKLLPHKLALETFDTVTLRFQTPIVASGDVDAIVESAVYNSDDHTIDVHIRTPVRLGDMSPYPFFWPEGIGESDFFPTFRDLTGNPSGQIGGGQLPAFNSQSTILDIAKIPSGGEGEGQRKSWDSGDPEGGGGGTGDADNTYVGDYELPEWGNVSLDPLVNDYTYPTLKDPDVPPVKVGSETFPGVIQEYGGEQDSRPYYKVAVYAQGLGGDPVTFDKVLLLQLDRRDRIPPGSWNFVTVTTFRKGAKYVREATMQFPVWLK